MEETYLVQNKKQPVAASEEKVNILIHQPGLRSGSMHVGKHVCTHVESTHAVKNIVVAITNVRQI